MTFSVAITVARNRPLAELLNTEVLTRYRNTASPPVSLRGICTRTVLHDSLRSRNYYGDRINKCLFDMWLGEQNNMWPKG